MTEECTAGQKKSVAEKGANDALLLVESKPDSGACIPISYLSCFNKLFSVLLP